MWWLTLCLAALGGGGVGWGDGLPLSSADEVKIAVVSYPAYPCLVLEVK